MLASVMKFKRAKAWKKNVQKKKAPEGGLPSRSRRMSLAKMEGRSWSKTDHQSADFMRTSLEAKGIPIKHFNVISEKISEKLAEKRAQRDSKQQSKMRLCRQLCRTLLNLFLFFLFCAAGAGVYHYVEYPVEVMLVQEYDETAEILQEAANATDILEATGDEEPMDETMDEISVEEKALIFDDKRISDPDTMSERLELVVEEAHEPDAAPPEGGVLRWEFDTSMFWALTVVTTVGYGQFNPITHMGQLFCIPFGFIGLLVSGYALGNLASTICLFLEYVFGSCLPEHKEVAENIDDNCTKATADAELHQQQKTYAWRQLILSSAYLLLYVVGSTWIFAELSEDEEWGWVESFYWSFVTISTIGFGDYVPDDRWLLCATIFMIFGIGMFNMFIGSLIELTIASPGDAMTLTEQILMDHVHTTLCPLDWIYCKEFDDDNAAAEMWRSRRPSSPRTKLAALRMGSTSPRPVIGGEVAIAVAVPGGGEVEADSRTPLIPKKP